MGWPVLRDGAQVLAVTSPLCDVGTFLHLSEWSCPTRVFLQHLPPASGTETSNSPRCQGG